MKENHQQQVLGQCREEQGDCSRGRATEENYNKTSGCIYLGFLGTSHGKELDFL